MKLLNNPQLCLAVITLFLLATVTIAPGCAQVARLDLGEKDAQEIKTCQIVHSSGGGMASWFSGKIESWSFISTGDDETCKAAMQELKAYIEGRRR